MLINAEDHTIGPLLLKRTAYADMPWAIQSAYSNGTAVAHPCVLFESRGILRPKSWPNFGGKCI